MEPENHVVAQLRAIRAGIDTMREDLGDRLDGLTEEVRGNGKRLESLEGHMELVAGEVTTIQLHLEWLRAQIGLGRVQQR